MLWCYSFIDMSPELVSHRKLHIWAKSVNFSHRTQDTADWGFQSGAMKQKSQKSEIIRKGTRLSLRQFEPFVFRFLSSSQGGMLMNTLHTSWEWIVDLD